MVDCFLSVDAKDPLANKQQRKDVHATMMRVRHSPWFVALFVTVLVTHPDSASGFAQTSLTSRNNNVWTVEGSIKIRSHQVLRRRRLTVVKSSKVLPIAYTSASAALLYKGIKTVTRPEQAVLLATSALSLINFGPCDNAKLASAKRACKNTAPSSAGKAKQERQAALTWRSVVRIKIIGQVIGLTWMALSRTTIGTMRSAALVMGANLAFYLCGAGRSWHDENGKWKPNPDATRTTVVIFCTVVSALIAASNPFPSSLHTVGAGFFSAITSIAALEGIPQIKKTINSNK